MSNVGRDRIASHAGIVVARLGSATTTAVIDGTLVDLETYREGFPAPGCKVIWTEDEGILFLAEDSQATSSWTPYRRPRGSNELSSPIRELHSFRALSLDSQWLAYVYQRNRST